MNGWVSGRNWVLFGLGGMRYDGCDVVVEMSSSYLSVMTSTGSSTTPNARVSEYKPVCPFGYAPETSKGTGKVEDEDKEEEGDEDDCSGFLPKLIEVNYVREKGATRTQFVLEIRGSRAAKCSIIRGINTAFSS
ncbi:hypothetical protein K435DRAFT_799855 [Dendrothele bispora CBS 962.96]|uniref:Uncharacterized protein n=1 Tax=Dendrothele bispora (strain CBS 962.96) TaxID=1314807 RepID=A0A4V4HF21_DENBC|nr:hypothetical protein K435DRAFT_799855 [Dendrothele bispora CBS 962.96]